MRSELWLLPCLLTGASAQEAVIAHWPLDAVVEGTVAEETGALPGTAEGEPLPQPAEGLVGGSLAFGDGDGFVAIPNSSALDLTPPFTVAAWVRPEKFSPDQELLCRRGDTEDAGWRFRLGWGILSFELHDGTDRIRVSTPARTVETGFWAHVAAVHDGQTITLYLNAEPVVSEPITAAPKPTGRGAVLGNYTGRKNAYAFVGRLDDVWVIGEALDGEGLYRLASGGN